MSIIELFDLVPPAPPPVPLAVDPLDVPGLIRRARRIRDVNQRELAKLLGVGKSTVGRWEQRESEPSLTHFQRLLALAGLRLRVVDEVGDDAEPMKPDAVRDGAGRRYAAHLDVHILDFGLPTHWNRPIPIVRCPLRPMRDALRHFTGVVPHDHPSPADIEHHHQARRQRKRDRDAALRDLHPPVTPEPECCCLVDCWNGRACLPGCPCQCEVVQGPQPWYRDGW